jgi:hypothetical protein
MTLPLHEIASNLQDVLEEVHGQIERQAELETELDNAKRTIRDLDANGVHGEVARELASAVLKFGAFHNDHEGWAVLREEVDELWEAVKADDPMAARAEAVQVAAMAVRFVVDGDARRRGPS